MCVCVSHVLDSQLLNGWTYGHENSRVCSRTRSHDSVIFFVFFGLIFYGEFKMRENKLRVNIPATAESSRSSGQSIIKIGYGRLSPQWHNAIVAAGGAIILIGTVGCGFYGPNDPQL